MTAMAAPVPTGIPISVQWHRAGLGTDEALRRHLADDLTPMPGADLRIGHLCPRCGGADHGRPWARAGERTIAVSAARAGGHLVTAAGLPPVHRIGVDIECADAVPIDPTLVLHRDESGQDVLQVWVAKEAILKMLGVGLSVSMPSIRVADFSVHDLPAPAGLLARVCVSSP